jgi:two-component system, LytTR family, sensor kinase
MIHLRKYTTILQIIPWVVLWLILPFLIGNNTNNYIRPILMNLPLLLGVILAIIINLHILMPRFYFQKKKIIYITLSLLIIAGIILLIKSDFLSFSKNIKPPQRPVFIGHGRPLRPPTQMPVKSSWTRYFIPLLVAYIVSTLIEVTRYASQKEKEKLNTEIKFLKSQINPHFLFNTLNNIYTLTVIKSDKASESLLSLSQLLRYMLYDSNEVKVALKKEIEYLQNYIDLALLKDSRGLNINLEVRNNHPNLLVAPLLFIPFVENALKHSKIEDLKEGMINIHLKTFENTIEFFVENSIPKNVINKDKVGGIGLKNVKQRLQLLYPNKHKLEIESNETLYKVYLKLYLS